MSFLIKQEVVRALMHADVQVEDGDGAAPIPSPSGPRGDLQYQHADAATLEALAAADDNGGDEEIVGGLPVVEQRHVDPDRDVGRNEPCWCGSGKKFKRCHGA
jgi:preprotein translocase subunit SecA